MAGLRILEYDRKSLAAGQLRETAFFDVVPGSTSQSSPAPGVADAPIRRKCAPVEVAGDRDGVTPVVSF
jgi:hypothetical protein